MKKRKIFRILLWSVVVISGASVLAILISIFDETKTDHSDSKALLKKIKLKLESNEIDGSSLDELLPIDLQKDKILNLINNVDANIKKFEVRYI